jgi:hypothetical protein
MSDIAKKVIERLREWVDKEHGFEDALLVSMVQRIQRENKGRNTTGTETCPRCQGVIEWSHAAGSGRVRGRCETFGCLVELP